MTILLRLPRLRAVVDVLFPDPIAADDRFIPLQAAEIEQARLREIASLKALARRAERPALRLLVNR